MANDKGKKRGAIPETVQKLFTMPETVTGLSNIGYQAARYTEQGSNLVASLIAANVGWPDKVSDDNMALLKSGIVLRKHEITPPTWYRVEGKNLIELDKPPTKAELDASVGNFLKLDVAYATGITPHNLGGMKESHPAEYDKVVELRKAASKYVSNVIGRLRSMTKAMVENERTRGATKSIKERVDEFFKNLKRGNKAARENRGDPTAFDDDVLDKKIAAFWKAE